MGEFTNEDRGTLVECRTLLKGVNKRLSDHENRLRKTESRQIWLMGWGGGVGIALGSLYQYLKLK